MQSIIKNTLLVLVALAVLALFASLIPLQAEAVLPSYHAKVARTATTTVGPQTDILISHSRELCASRVVTTYTQPISLSFIASSTFNVSPTEGHLQGASTTVAYDAELFGCGQIVVASGVSTTITVTDFAF